mmetsp:Transcript_13772/g.21873  ORF Transcript_13772/g.21873 Transcript_13772/m.21873 type:complete len:302 (+) Transcript_13772:223-1128(+)
MFADLVAAPERHHKGNEDNNQWHDIRGIVPIRAHCCEEQRNIDDVDRDQVNPGIGSPARFLDSVNVVGFSFARDGAQELASQQWHRCVPKASVGQAAGVLHRQGGGLVANAAHAHEGADDARTRIQAHGAATTWPTGEDLVPEAEVAIVADEPHDGHEEGAQQHDPDRTLIVKPLSVAGLVNGVTDRFDHHSQVRCNEQDTPNDSDQGKEFDEFDIFPHLLLSGERIVKRIRHPVGHGRLSRVGGVRGVGNPGGRIGNGGRLSHRQGRVRRNPIVFGVNVRGLVHGLCWIHSALCMVTEKK